VLPGSPAPEGPTVQPFSWRGLGFTGAKDSGPVTFLYLECLPC
jgi:hypothetical protein